MEFAGIVDTIRTRRFDFISFPGWNGEFSSQIIMLVYKKEQRFKSSNIRQYIT